LAEVLEEEGDADGGDEDRETGAIAKGAVGELFDDDTKDGAYDHCNDEHEECARPRGAAVGELEDGWGDVEAGEGADHEDITVGEIDEAEDAVHHCVAKGNEGVDGPEGEAIDELLEEFDQVG